MKQDKLKSENKGFFKEELVFFINISILIAGLIMATIVIIVIPLDSIMLKVLLIFLFIVSIGGLYFLLKKEDII